MLDLNNKIFMADFNSENGEVSESTVFKYYQEKHIIWADYSGGVIIKGSLIGKFIREDSIEFVYHHINDKNELLTGKCISKIEIDENAKLLLNESWQWTCKDNSKGKSKLREL